MEQDLPRGPAAPSLAGKNAPRADEHGKRRKARARRLRSRRQASAMLDVGGETMGRIIIISPRTTYTLAGKKRPTGRQDG